MSFSRGKIIGFSVLMIVLVLISGLIAGFLRETGEPFDIGDYSGIDPNEEIARYETEPNDEVLAKLVRILCWQYKSAGNEAAATPLLDYGTLLKEHAKAGICDLEKLDDKEGTLLKTLSVISSLEGK